MIGFVRKAAAALTQLAGARAVVLLYHRIAEPRVDPWELAVAPRHFEEQLAVLRRRLPIVALHQLPRVLASRRAPRCVAAVTFDDGYADSLHVAMPILARHDVPATLFVSSGLVGASEFWWDRLTRIVLEPASVPRTLRCHPGSETTPMLVDLSGDDDGGRRSGYNRLYQGLRDVPPEVRVRALDDLEQQVSPGLPEARPLTQPELRMLRDTPFTLGGHTITHPRLITLTVNEQRTEIALGRKQLQEWSGAPITSFAYPFGRPGDYDEATVALVREAGYSLGCVNSSGKAVAGSDPYRLPRAYVRNLDGDRFSEALDVWLQAPAR